MNTELEDSLKEVNAKLGVHKHYTYTKKLIIKDNQEFKQLSLINANKYK